MHTPDTLGWAWVFARPYRRALATLAALSIAEIALRMLAPFAMLVVVDHALGGAPVTGRLASVLGTFDLSSDPHALLVGFAVAGMSVQLAHELVVMAHGRLNVRLGQRMIAELRERLFAHVQALSIKHHGETPTGEVVQCLGADTRCIEQIVLRGVLPIGFSLITLLAMFAVLLVLDVQLALLSLAVVPPLYAWLRFYAARMVPRADRARRTESQMSTRVVETMTAIRLVKSHAREDYEHARFAAVARENASAWIDVGRQSTVFAITTAALTIAGSSVILVVGGLAVLDGRLSLGTLLLVIAYLGYVYGPLSAIAHTTNELQHAFASARRVQEAFAIEPERDDLAGARSADGVRGEIAFEDVTVSYGGSAPALDHVSFVTKPGELIALVGPSGAGKSTLATAIARFHDPVTGRILLDGAPLADYQLHSLRRNVALVLQEAIIVAGSVADNLRYGRDDASDTDLQRAAHDADAHDFICELPDGYATVIGDGARALSGGQRQRLSIARAFLKDAPVLVFDEPTSALDTIAEDRIVSGLRRLALGRTTFVVAHRLSTVRHADRILVLDRGRIVADGNHETLLETSPLYQRLAAQLAVPTDGERVTNVA